MINRILTIAEWCGLSILLFMAMLLAPAPQTPVKEKKPPVVKEAPCPFIGGWILLWRGGTGPCWISNDGVWQCSWNGSVWEGTWTWKDGRLTVRETEKTGDGDGATLEWTITLNLGTLRGFLHDGSEAALLPLVMKPDA